MAERLLPGVLHLVTDFALCPLDRLRTLLPDLLTAGVDTVHLRAPDWGAGQVYEAARMLRPLLAGRACFLINDRVDVALAIEADGVQLGERSLPVRVVRQRWGDRLVIGASVHSLERAVAVAAEGADFLLVGTIFPSRSHPGEGGAGVDLIRRIAARVERPLVGIGGITPENAGAVIAAGATGVAVISAILAAPEPAAAARALRTAVEAGRAGASLIRRSADTG